MDTNLIIQSSIAIINLIFVILMLISVILIYRTIKSNQNLNQKTLFNEIVKQERELRIKLNEYREKIDDEKIKGRKKEIIKFNYDTLLFDYYEYLAVCLIKKTINESEAKLLFRTSLINIKKHFDKSLLFKKGAAQKEEYLGIQWLFKKWKIE